MQTHLYDNFPAKYSIFSKISYRDPLQIEIQEKKNLFVTIFRITISFLDSHILNIPAHIRNAEFYSFNLFYLDCLFKFSPKKTAEKYTNFVDYLIVWCESTTTALLLESWKQPQNSTGWDPVSTADEVTVYHSSFWGILAPVVQYEDKHYPRAKFISSSILCISD